MLINFRVKNYKSFNEEAILNQVAGKSRQHENRVASYPNINVLKFGALFGANGSGKSNLVSALAVMKSIVLTNQIPAEAINECFRLEDKCEGEPTYFEITISIAGRFFNYGFEVSLLTNIFSSEWLIEKIPTRDGPEREKILFERDGNHIEMPILKKINIKDTSNRLMVYKTDAETKPKVLFLNLLNMVASASLLETKNENLTPLHDTFAWFRDKLSLISPNTPFTSPEYLTSDPKCVLLKDLLKSFDTGIIDIKEKEATEEEFLKTSRLGIDLSNLKSILSNQRYRQSENGKTKQTSLIIRTNLDFWTITLKNDGTFNFMRLVFLHDDNDKHEFSLKDESDGTIRIFDLAEVLLAEPTDKVFVIDEIDRSLHPALTLHLVEMFLERASNPAFTNQLLITTHESRLLDLNVLRRDEIYFANKKNGASSIYSLEEFNERFDKVIDKAYLDGRYGGVPIFESLYLKGCFSNENKE